MAALLPYKTAKLADTDPKDWFVYFYYLNPETKKYDRFKERGYLNNRRYLQQLSARYGKSIEECRQATAEEMISTINEELQKGFNPFQQQPQIESEKHDTLLATVQHVVAEMCKVGTQNRNETYRLMLSRFKKFVEAKKLSEWPLPSFGLEQAEDFQAYMQREMKLAKKTVNSTISHLGLFWDELKKKVKANPFRQVKPLTDADYRGLIDEDDDVFEPLTSTELDLILKELRSQKQDGFIVFLAFIYYAWMRPVEITRLKVSSIDLQAGVIRTKKADTKNKKGGLVQIVPQLMNELKKIQLEKVSRMDWYLFGKGFKPGPKPLDASRGVGYYWWNPVVEKLG
ncbi:MAG: hypothetical protein EOO10_19860, partial [Chitinophagaceae bacterium]